MTEEKLNGIWHTPLDEYTHPACHRAHGSKEHGPMPKGEEARCRCVMYTDDRRGHLRPFKTFVPWSRLALFIQSELRDAPMGSYTKIVPGWMDEVRKSLRALAFSQQSGKKDSDED